MQRINITWSNAEIAADPDRLFYQMVMIKKKGSKCFPWIESW